MDKPHIKINMLGEFKISVGQAEVIDTGKPRKLWTLLGFLVANHKENITQQQLIDLLCSDEDTPDPIKVIKNLVYRLRKMLVESPLPDLDYIVRNGSVYAWNNELECEIDTEKFENLILLAQKTDGIEDKIKYYKSAIDLYKGNFLPTAEYELWAMEFSAYYQRLFFGAVHELYNIIEKANSGYSDMAEVCEKAISVDKFAEEIHIIYIKSLIKSNQHKKALKHYEHVISLLYDELGVNPSSDLKSVYSELTKEVKGVEMDLGLIKEGFNEEMESSESFFCDYHVFKDIYRFVARRIQRTGEPFYILLCTVMDKNGNFLENEKQAKAMEEFKDNISKTLRKGDVFSRYSKSQFVIMLSDISFENGRKVTNRLKTNYKNYKTADKVSITYNLQAIDSKLI